MAKRKQLGNNRGGASVPPSTTIITERHAVPRSSGMIALRVTTRQELSAFGTRCLLVLAALGQKLRAWGRRAIKRRAGPQGNGPEAVDEEPRTAPSDSRTAILGSQKGRHQPTWPPDHPQTKVCLGKRPSLLRRNLSRLEPNMQHSTRSGEARCSLRLIY